MIPQLDDVPLHKNKRQPLHPHSRRSQWRPSRCSFPACFWRWKLPLCFFSCFRRRCIIGTSLFAVWFICPVHVPLRGKHVLFLTQKNDLFWRRKRSADFAERSFVGRREFSTRLPHGSTFPLPFFCARSSFALKACCFWRRATRHPRFGASLNCRILTGMHLCRNNWAFLA